MYVTQNFASSLFLVVLHEAQRRDYTSPDSIYRNSVPRGIPALEPPLIATKQTLTCMPYRPQHPYEFRKSTVHVVRVNHQTAKAGVTRGQGVT